MMRWLLLLIAFPLLSHAAVERLVTSAEMSLDRLCPSRGGEPGGAGQHQQLAPAAQKLPDVGYLRQLNAEGILALRPQLVLASAQAQPSLVLHKVQASGVKVVNVPGGESLSAIDNKVAVIAEALGKTAAGDALRQQLQQQIAAIPTQPVAKRVLFILSHGGMNTGGRTAYRGRWRHSRRRIAERDAGLRPLSRHVAGRGRRQPGGSGGDLRRWSQRDGRRSRLWKLPGLAQTGGRHKQLLTIDDMALLGFGPRTPQAIIALRNKAEQLP